jgi:hypothetical protein
MGKEKHWAENRFPEYILYLHVFFISAKLWRWLSATFLLYLWIHHTNLNKIVGAKVGKILILTRCGSWMALQLSHPTK